MDKQDELFIVVDKNDKIISHRTRYDCHHNRQLIHRAIGVVIFNDKEQVLLQKRSKYKDLYPGQYTISVSGHVSKGETYEQATERELQEELGIQAPLVKKIKYLAETDQETEMDCLFIAKHNGPFYPNKDEVNEVKFVATDQLQKLKPQLTPFAIFSLQKLSLL